MVTNGNVKTKMVLSLAARAALYTHYFNYN